MTRHDQDLVKISGTGDAGSVFLDLYISLSRTEHWGGPAKNN